LYADLDGPDAIRAAIAKLEAMLAEPHDETLEDVEEEPAELVTVGPLTELLAAQRALLDLRA
jgi:hypothetical protein